MTDNSHSRKGPAVRSGLVRVLCLPFDVLSAVGEAALTPRGMSAGFFLIALVLATSGWLRPPLSHDIRSVYLSLGLVDSASQSPAEMLYGTRRVPIDSAGVAVVVLIAVAAALVFRKPARFAGFAGVLLCASLGATAATIVNHPALIELFDFEQKQRGEIVAMLRDLEANAVTDNSNARVRALPAEEGERGGLTRGFVYVWGGWWLIPFAAGGVLFGSRGPLRRRLGRLSIWLLLGAVLSGALCFRRVRAEYHWMHAERLEAEGNSRGARQALETAVSQFPEFSRLERTWLLEGKLDFREGKTTSYERFFRAHQLGRNGEFSEAIALMEDALEAGGRGRAAAHYQLANLLTAAGLEHHSLDRFEAAVDVWQRAKQMVPFKLDCAFYLGTLRAQTDRARPHLAEDAFAPLLERLADRALRADILASLGDAYFETGQMAGARRRYEDSYTAFNLPKKINYRAQKGLLGM